MMTNRDLRASRLLPSCFAFRARCRNGHYLHAEHACQPGVPLAILAGKEYGSGSSRDWAAKGPLLLGVRFVIAESYERIHRSNLVGMGILPLQFAAAQNVASLGLRTRDVHHRYEIR